MGAGQDCADDLAGYEVPQLSAARHSSRDQWRRAQRLEHDTVALRQLQQGCDLLVRGGCIEFESQPDVPEADGNVLRDAQRSAEVEITRCVDRSAFDRRDSALVGWRLPGTGATVAQFH